MSDDTDDAPARKGRSNAILTYEKLESLVVGISRANGKIDQLTEKLEDMKDLHVDHEVRIKSLELTLATVIAGRNNRLSVWQWVWTGLVFTVPLTITIIDKFFK